LTFADPADAELLSRVRHLHLRARKTAEALLLGEHRARRSGSAVEFADYQDYRPGDDHRRLDWRVWGRTDRLMIRRYEAETELPCVLVLDASADAGTGRRGRGRPPLEGSKLGTMVTLAATLAWFLQRHGEPVGLEILGGEGMALSSLPPRGGVAHLHRLFTLLAAVRPAGRADLQASLLRIGGRVRRRAWVGVLTDGMEDPAGWLPALAAFVRRGADVRFFHTWDPAELRLEGFRPARFYSPEGGEVALDPGQARTAFQEEVKAYFSQVRQGVLQWGGRYLPLPVDLDLDLLLRAAILDHPWLLPPDPGRALGGSAPP
jgi:uncharacterized protein (DUF58 family)